MQEKNERLNPFYFMATSSDGWLPSSLTNTLNVQDFLNDIYTYSQSNIITPEFRKDNSYISYHLCNLGNISLLRAWHNGDLNAVAHEYIVAPLSHYEGDMRKRGLRQDEINEKLKRTAYYLISLALRNSSESEVLELTKTTSDLLGTSDAKTGFDEGQKDAFKAFERWGCQIARYQKPKDLSTIQARYTSINSGFLSLDKEIAFGEKSFKDAEQALKLCTDDKAKTKNETMDFLKTTPERQGMRLAVEFLMEQHSNITKARSMGDNYQAISASKEMGKVRTQLDLVTPLIGYAWATPLVEEMVHLANNATITDMRPVEEGTVEGAGYECLYVYENELHVVHRFHQKHSVRGDLVAANRSLAPFYVAHWAHGTIPLEKLWPRLEELHHEVMTFPLDHDDAASLMEFYDKVIETVWLLGNLTPTNRGTGKTVEQWLTMAHLQHGLRTPILRIENPQLDVLNITLPLSIYKQRFLEYFEPESLPEPLTEYINRQAAIIGKLEKNLDNSTDRIGSFTTSDIKGFNTRYSLFPPAKAPLIPETEEIEKKLNEQSPPPEH